jgi:hypothetical protein
MDQGRALNESWESRDDAGRVIAFGGTTDAGLDLRMHLSVLQSNADAVREELRLDTQRWQRGTAARMVAEAGDAVFLTTTAFIDTQDGEARTLARADDLDYYVWLGGSDSPAAEGKVNGRGFTVRIDPETGQVPAAAALGTYLPAPLEAHLSLLLPALQHANASLPAPPEFEDEGVDGPGAWRRTPSWWREWRTMKHQCWGLCGAAGSICCGGATMLGGPVGFAMGCGIGGWVFGTIASICAERSAARLAAT